MAFPLAGANDAVAHAAANAGPFKTNVGDPARSPRIAITIIWNFPAI